MLNIRTRIQTNLNMSKQIRSRMLLKKKYPYRRSGGRKYRAGAGSHVEPINRLAAEKLAMFHRFRQHNTVPRIIASAWSFCLTARSPAGCGFLPSPIIALRFVSSLIRCGRRAQQQCASRGTWASRERSSRAGAAAHFRPIIVFSAGSRTLLNLLMASVCLE
jgi:hypothetical protein